MRYSRTALLVIFLAAFAFGMTFSTEPVHASLGTRSSAPDSAHVSAALKSAPAMIIENVGQFDAGARFQVRGGNGTMWLAENAIWVTVPEKPKADASAPQTPPSLRRPHEPQRDTPRKGVNLRLSFPGANSHPTLEPFNPARNSHLILHWQRSVGMAYRCAGVGRFALHGLVSGH